MPSAPGPGGPLGGPALTDLTIVGVIVVLAMILIVGVTTFLIVRFLRGVVDGDRRPPPVECAAWLRARRAAEGGLREPALTAPPSPLDFCKAPLL